MTQLVDTLQYQLWIAVESSQLPQLIRHMALC